MRTLRLIIGIPLVMLGSLGLSLCAPSPWWMREAFLAGLRSALSEHDRKSLDAWEKSMAGVE